MDTFMDKLAQKLNAQEMIKANSAADTAKMEKMQEQVTEYQNYLQEARKCNLKNIEISEDMKKALDAEVEKLENKLQELENAMQRLDDKEKSENAKLEEVKLAVEKLQEAIGNFSGVDKETIEGLFRASDEYTHKEDVKVYRNVQAVIEEEGAKQTEAFKAELKNTNKKLTWSLVFSILAFVAATAGVVLQVLQILGIM